MTRHLSGTRVFPLTYATGHQHMTVSDAHQARPCAGGYVSLVTIPQPVGVGGQPYMGMDPSAPATWVRPYNPQPGMVSQLNFDGAKAQSYAPTGGVWRNPMYDRADVPPSKAQHVGRIRRWRRRRGLSQDDAASPHPPSGRRGPGGDG